MVGEGPASSRAREALAMLRAEISLHPRTFVLAVFGAAVFALGTIASSIAIRWVIDHVLVPRFEEGHVALGTVLAGIGLLIGIGLVRAAGVICRRVFAGITQWRIATTLGEQVTERLVRQPVTWHQRRPDGDLVARAGVDVDAAVAVMAPIPFSFGTVLLVVVSAAWLLVSDIVIGLVAVAVFPVLIAVNVLYQRRVDRHYTEAQEHLGRLSAAVHESFEGVQLVKAYGAEQRETERLSAIAGQLRNARVRAVRLRGTFEALLDVLPSLTNVALVVVGAMRVDAGEITVGELSSFVFLFTLLVFPLRLIGYVLSEIPHSVAGYRRVTTVLEEPMELDPRSLVEPAPAGLAAELDAVVFSFPDDPRPALDHVSMRIERGRVVAIVGPTGAGKSTLVELLAGLVAPTSGTVRRAPGPVAIVFQEAFLFSGTIRHNLELGRRHADEDLWDALALAEGAEFVGETPHQLDTVVGERGVSLSGGQRQRVALARALLRRPDLLLLDDTTSALDPATEAAVLANLRQGLAGTTVVMVASRPSTIALADEVMYLAGGRLVAHGSHAALMAAHDGYRSLVEAFESDRAEDEEAVGAGVRRD
jgi:ABC-type multidrug transport system fused ATPase/permease subunit